LDISFLSSESAMITGTIVNADLMISSSMLGKVKAPSSQVHCSLN
jgi:hypothetical protein